MAEKPYRLHRPHPEARAAIALFGKEEGQSFNTTEPLITLVPIVQWSSIRIRVRVSAQAATLNVAFARPNREAEPRATPATDSKLDAFLYTADQPAIDGTALVAATEQSLEITAAEHQGENWLRVEIVPSVNGMVLDFCDISGVLLGTSP